MAEQYRQGDLLFVRQDSLPVAASLATRNSVVILEGETTGHAHRLASRKTGAILETPDGQLWLDITRATQIVHEEHHAITLDPGAWLVVRQREYSPEAIRLVVD